jgi:hypothetical protein
MSFVFFSFLNADKSQ